MNDVPVNLACWLDRRLAATLSFHLPAVRLYGLVVNDAHGLADDTAQAARSSFLGEHPDGYELLRGSFGVLARSFDAAAIVTTGWIAPMVAGELTHAPSRHPLRQRVRAVAVVSDDGLGGVMRMEDDPDTQVELPGRTEGAMAAAMLAMWRGVAGDLVNLRTTRGRCSRLP